MVDVDGAPFTSGSFVKAIGLVSLLFPLLFYVVVVLAERLERTSQAHTVQSKLCLDFGIVYNKMERLSGLCKFYCYSPIKTIRICFNILYHSFLTI